MYEQCIKVGDVLEIRNKFYPGLLQSSQLKEVMPTRTCKSSSNSAVHVRDRLASYVVF